MKWRLLLRNSRNILFIYLMYSDYSPEHQNNLYMKKYFFQTYATSIFHFFSRSFFIIINVNLKIFIKTETFIIKS